MASIKKDSIESITAGKLLQEFTKGYNDEPFGESGLIIVKQLLDLAIPHRSLKELIPSEELHNLLTKTGKHFDIRNKPFFLDVINFLITNSTEKLNKMKPNQLKKELLAILTPDLSPSNIENGSTTYELFGDPESASFAKKILEGALINTTASLFEYLLIDDKKKSGKIFNDLEKNIQATAKLVSKTRPLITILSELVKFNWKFVSIGGCLPTLQELKIKDVCQYTLEHPQDYLEKIKEKILKKFDLEFKQPLHKLINTCKLRVEKSNTKFDLEIEVEFPLFEKRKNRVINDLKKLQSRAKARKKVAPKDFERIGEDLDKNCGKFERDIIKEFMIFYKLVNELLPNEPPWLKYTKKESGWETESTQEVIGRLNDQLTIPHAFQTEKKSKDIQIAMVIFEQLGGIHFAMENIIAHYFYECVTPRVVNLIETPAKREKVKELKFLKEMRYIEGLDSVRKFLVKYSEILISNLLSLGLNTLKESYIRNNPIVLAAEEQVRNPHYLSLLDLPKELLDEIPPEDILGKEYFLYRADGNSFHIGLHLKSLNGKGNELFSLLVSSSALENSLIYKKATRILGNFSGYVYHTARGNMRVCPPVLKSVDDLFM